jgi:hypothetical protein
VKGFFTKKSTDARDIPPQFGIVFQKKSCKCFKLKKLTFFGSMYLTQTSRHTGAVDGLDYTNAPSFAEQSPRTAV